MKTLSEPTLSRKTLQRAGACGFLKNRMTQTAALGVRGVAPRQARMCKKAITCHTKFIDVELEGVALENILRKVVRQETRVIPYLLTAMPDHHSKSRTLPRKAVNADRLRRSFP